MFPKMGQQFTRSLFFGLIITLAVGSSFSMDLSVVLEQPLISSSPDVVATSLILDFPPGDEGSPPHTHSGPVVGYVVSGLFLLQINNDPPQLIPAGSSFYELYGVTHTWGANASDNSTCQVLATVYGRPGEPILTFVEDYPRLSRAEAIAQANLK